MDVEAQWKLAEHELQMRLGKNTRKIAIAALVVSMLSFALAAWSYWRLHR